MSMSYTVIPEEDVLTSLVLPRLVASDSSARINNVAPPRPRKLWCTRGFSIFPRKGPVSVTGICSTTTPITSAPVKPSEESTLLISSHINLSPRPISVTRSSHQESILSSDNEGKKGRDGVIMRDARSMDCCQIRSDMFMFLWVKLNNKRF